MGFWSPFYPIKSKTVVFKPEKSAVLKNEVEQPQNPCGVELLGISKKNLKKAKIILDKNDRFWSAGDPLFMGIWTGFCIFLKPQKIQKARKYAIQGIKLHDFPGLFSGVLSFNLCNKYRWLFKIQRVAKKGTFNCNSFF